MILNTSIFKQTVETAKAKSAGNASILLGIERATIEIEKAKYWSFSDGVLTLISTTSDERYVIDSAHECPARSKTCKHLIARRLMIRYFENLTAAEAVAVAEREALMTEIKANWTRRNPEFPLGLALQKRFGCNRLERVHPDYLPQIAAALR